MRRAWFCDGCDKEHSTKEEAQDCERNHDPFIHVISHDGRSVGKAEELILFVPNKGDVVIPIQGLIESIENEQVGPIWYLRHHEDEANIEAQDP